MTKEAICCLFRILSWIISCGPYSVPTFAERNVSLWLISQPVQCHLKWFTLATERRVSFTKSCILCDCWERNSEKCEVDGFTPLRNLSRDKNKNSLFTVILWIFVEFRWWSGTNHLHREMNWKIEKGMSYSAQLINDPTWCLWMNSALQASKDEEWIFYLLNKEKNVSFWTFPMHRED